jgi:hypothetical protein
MRYASVLFLVVLTSLAASATEFRMRTDFVGPGNRNHYEVVEVVKMSDEEESTSLLVRDSSTNDRFILKRVRSYTNRDVSWTISDVKNESFIRTSFSLPFTSKTREETLREGREHPNLTTLPAILMLETNGGRWDAVDTAWEEWAELRSLRHEVRRLMSFHLLEGIERMRDSVLAHQRGSTFMQLVARFALYGTKDEQASALKPVRAMPDCELDSSFGMPCTETQLKQVKEAAAEGRLLEHY